MRLCRKGAVLTERKYDQGCIYHYDIRQQHPTKAVEALSASDVCCSVFPFTIYWNTNESRHQSGLSMFWEEMGRRSKTGNWQGTRFEGQEPRVARREGTSVSFDSRKKDTKITEG